MQAGLAIVLAVGAGALICLVIASNWDAMTVSERSDFNPVFLSLNGTVFSDIVLMVTGVMFLSSEYTSGMIRLTLTVTPSRLRVLFAKLVVISAVTWALGLLVVLGSFLAGQAVLGTHAGIPTMGLRDREAQRGIIVAWLTTPLFPLIGAALGGMLRNTATAITSTLAIYFVPSIFSGFLPEWWRSHFIAYLPENASEALLRSETNFVGYLSPSTATLTICIWLALFFAGAAVLLQRRDV